MNFTDQKIKLLEKRLEQLIQKFKALYEQEGSAINEGDKIPLRTQYEQVEKQIKETQDELDKLRASSQSKTVEDLKNEIKDLKDELSKLCENLQQRNKEFEKLVNNLSSRLNENEQKELEELFHECLESVCELCGDLNEVERMEVTEKEDIQAAINRMNQLNS